MNHSNYAIMRKRQSEEMKIIDSPKLHAKRAPRRGNNVSKILVDDLMSCFSPK